jgi:hypothetical protein
MILGRVYCVVKLVNANLLGLNANKNLYLRRKSRGETPCQLLNALEKDP